DCLEWMDRWDDGSVDMIYLDPPFNSQADYNILFGRTEGGAQYKAFTDIWEWDDAAAERLDRCLNAIARPAHSVIVGMERMLGPSGMLSYLTYMAERLEHCHRLLKPTGSIYLHCDANASHYLKLVLDAVFGPRQFRSDITWRRINRTGRGTRRLANNADNILYYVKGTSFTWNQPYSAHDPMYVEKMYRHVDEAGRRYRRDNLKGAGLRKGDSGAPWKGVDPSETGSHWAIPNAALPDEIKALSSQEKLDYLDDIGRIYWPPRGKVPSYVRYLDEMPGTPTDTIWDDVNSIGASSKERLGYPTQKPVKLLERIVEASSNPGDLVLDPFCGCGTTIAAARKLNRRWVGIDIDAFAIDIIRERLKDPAIAAYGIPYDLSGARRLARERPFAFETWAVRRLAGFVPNTKQVADGGVDGRGTIWEQPEGDLTKLALAQVKGGNFSLGSLRDFGHVIERDSAGLGCYLTLDRIDTSGARSEAARMGSVRIDGTPYPRMQRWSMAEYFDGLPPKLPLMADPYSGKPLQTRFI
ncbi:MAG: DNA methyltransferase, partial [Chloroflexota bacterium]|nr:DNA methyltransferase [Chloroflexota bacterium]